MKYVIYYRKLNSSIIVGREHFTLENGYIEQDFDLINKLKVGETLSFGDMVMIIRVWDNSRII